MKIKFIKNRILCVFAAIALCLFAFCQSYMIAKADSTSVGDNELKTTIKDFSKTSILDDLSDIPIELYPKLENTLPEVIRFQEYCYSDKAFFAEYYGLYVYIYNPSENPLLTDRLYRNVVNMAVKFDENGEPIEYQNLPLSYCDRTENNRFYKFRVDDLDKYSLLAHEKLYASRNNGQRRYDVVGVQLTYTDNSKLSTLTTDRRVAKTFYFNGYSAGCGENVESESTLACEYKTLETIDLDVGHFNYRTGDYKDYICDELNTVYFGVDDRYFTDYGGLQEIFAEWYEYRTQPIFVTSGAGTQNSDGSNVFDQAIGKVADADDPADIDPDLQDFYWRVFWHEVSSIDHLGSTIHRYYCSYNATHGGQFNATVENPITIKNVWDWLFGSRHEINDTLQPFYAQNLTTMQWFFYRAGASNSEEYKVSSEVVENYVKWYTQKFPNQNKLNGKYAENLFLSDIDEDRIELLKNPDDKRGYIQQSISADDTQDLLFEKNQSKWDRFWFGVEYETRGLEPIVVLDESIKTMDVNTFASMYYVGGSNLDKQNVYNDCLKMLENGKRPVLFRFAVTDYYASPARFDYADDEGFAMQNGYVAQQTCFLNFDVISLTFRDEKGTDTIIGVVADPIDIFNGLDAPPGLGEDDNWDWLFFLLALILAGVVLAIVSPILSPILTFLFKFLGWVVNKAWWLICLPFELIGKLFGHKRE